MIDICKSNKGRLKQFKDQISKYSVVVGGVDICFSSIKN